jgi:hypothetical protein
MFAFVRRVLMEAITRFLQRDDDYHWHRCPCGNSWGHGKTAGKLPGAHICRACGYVQVLKLYSDPAQRPSDSDQRPRVVIFVPRGGQWERVTRPPRKRPKAL